MDPSRGSSERETEERHRGKTPRAIFHKVRWQWYPGPLKAVKERGTRGQGRRTPHRTRTPQRGWYVPVVELATAIERGLAVVDTGPMTVDQALAVLAMHAAPALGASIRDLHEALRRRERIRPTALPGGVAVPHAIVPGLGRTLVVPMVVRSGVQFDAQQPLCVVIIGLFGDTAQPWEHVRMLARLAKIANDPRAIAALRDAIDAHDLCHRMLEHDAARV